MAGRMQGKVCIVFGATGSVGGTVCQRLAEEGATVVVHYNSNRQKADAIVQKIVDQGGTALPLKARVPEEEAIRALFQTTVDTYGHVDGVVNLISRDKDWRPTPVAQMEWQDWEVHLEAIQAHFLICKHAVPYMRQQRYGRIVFVSAGMAYRFYKGCAAYSTSKSGLNAFSKTLALEEGEHNITVNIIAPGKVVPMEIATAEANSGDKIQGDSLERCPLKRFCTPEDIANGALFFLSDDALCITGQTVYISGGEIMPMP